LTSSALQCRAPCQAGDATALSFGEHQAREHEMADSANAASPNVVLVHGAWADGSSWNEVIALLQAQGIPVVSVQPPLRRATIRRERSTVRSEPGRDARAKLSEVSPTPGARDFPRTSTARYGPACRPRLRFAPLRANQGLAGRWWHLGRFRRTTQFFCSRTRTELGSRHSLGYQRSGHSVTHRPTVAMSL
jgi:hypothetical protein